MAVGSGRVDAFIVAGETFSDETAEIVRFSGDGYDGQFYYRQALDPLDLTRQPKGGVTLDLPAVRGARVGYPTAAWLLSAGGRKALVPYALIAVNVLAIAATTYVLAGAAARSGRSAWWGGVASVTAGVVFALARNLADPLSACFAVIGAESARRGRYGHAGLSWSLAVVTKEQALLIPGAFAVAAIVQHFCEPGHRSHSRRHVAWIVPALTFLMWSATVYVRTGDVPVLQSSGLNAATPFAALVPALTNWTTPTSVVEILLIAELVLLLVLAWSALFHGTLWFRFVAVATLCVLAMASEFVYSYPAHFRSAADLLTVLWLCALVFRSARFVVPVALTQAVVAGAVGVQTILIL